MSRRLADQAITAGRVSVNHETATIGRLVDPETDLIELDGKSLAVQEKIYLMLNKPTGYVVTRRRQGKQTTLYDLLPEAYQNLSPVGRLDRDSSGLIILTNDGDLAFRLSHPKFQKTKIYKVGLDRALEPTDRTRLVGGVELEDGSSKLNVAEGLGKHLTVSLAEGRNRQIRRTFAAIGYEVKTLNRTAIGKLQLGSLKSGEYKIADREDLI